MKFIDWLMYKRTNPPDFPHVQTELGFLTEEECSDMADYIMNHQLIGNSILSTSFSSSYGFVIRFNKYSKFDFEHSKYDLKKLFDVFERIRVPGTNAYVCNPLILEKNKSVGYHYDNTLGIKTFFGASVLPICVTVIYLQLPKNFTGGELCLCDFEKTYTTEEAPVVGKKLVFRGDMCHAVNEFQTDEDTKRVSLVFEQYRIPEIDLCKATFTIVSGDRGAFL